MAEAGITEHIASQMKRLRKRRGWTAAQLAEQMTEVGVQWDRGTVTKLETMRRQNLTVVEWLALARVLDVAPVHLLVPVDEVSVPITAVEARPASLARAWVRGEYALPGTDERTYRAEVPLSELSSRSA